jgi:hypothetical protein
MECCPGLLSKSEIRLLKVKTLNKVRVLANCPPKTVEKRV